MNIDHIDFLALFIKNGTSVAERSSMSKKAFFLLLLFLLGVSCSPFGKRWQATTFLYFDTVCEINLFCSRSDFESGKKKIKEIFLDIETHFAPGVQSYSSPSVIFLYKKAMALYRNSQGCFDITVEPLSRLWGFRDNSHRIPGPSEIERALENVGMDKILLESEKLYLKPGMELDWGGIAKGFGIDRVSQAAKQVGIESGFINAGGDLYCWGKNPDHKPWRIGIKHPRKEGISGILLLSNMGAATTGDYQRFFIQEGIRYHHVFDPKSGYPAKGKQSVTVVGPETLLCDALSTALFVSEQPEKILEKFPEYGAVVIDSEGRINLIGKTFPIQLEG
jgi:thiamine biosynthesis lipoprotein